MFRSTDTFETAAPFSGDADPAPARVARMPWTALDAGEEVGTLMPVYTEIARRLSRNAYTSYGATL